MDLTGFVSAELSPPVDITLTLFVVELLSPEMNSSLKLGTVLTSQRPLFGLKYGNRAPLNATALVDDGLWKVLAGTGAVLFSGLMLLLFRRRRADEEFEISMLSIEPQSQSAVDTSVATTVVDGEDKYIGLISRKNVLAGMNEQIANC